MRMRHCGGLRSTRPPPPPPSLTGIVSSPWRRLPGEVLRSVAVDEVGMGPFSGGPDETVRLTAWVRGQVQGVGFRWWVRARALELGLVGSATNLRDRRVGGVSGGGRAARPAPGARAGAAAAPPRGPRAGATRGRDPPRPR